MARLPNAFQADEQFKLHEHREYVQRTSGILSGQWAQSVRDYGDTVIVMAYRAPSSDDIVRQPDLADTKYGKLIFDDEGKISAVLPDKRNAILDLTIEDPERALAYVGQILQETMNRKVELRLAANELIEERRRRSSLPEGVLDMLQIYEDLLKQIEHEHFRQRDRHKERAIFSR